MKIPKMPRINLPKVGVPKLDDISKKLTTPTAFSTYAVIGVVSTFILTVIATQKDCEARYEKRAKAAENGYLFAKPTEEIFTEEVRKDTMAEVKKTVKVYAPALICAATTIFCIRKSNQKWMAYNSIINASYMAARDKMARYRALAAPAVGAEVIQGLHGMKSDEDVEWFCIENPKWHSMEISSERFGEPYEEPERIYFQSTAADVIDAEYHINRNFALRGSSSVREVFAFLGILDKFQEEYGDCLGWVADIMISEWEVEPWIDFEHWHTKDPSTGEVINMIDFTWPPGYTEDCSVLAWGYAPGSGCNAGVRTSLSPRE